VLNSGNAIFIAASGAKNLAQQIEAAMQQRTGVQSRVQVVPLDRLDTVIGENALLDRMTDAARMTVAFIGGSTTARSVPLPDARSIAPDVLQAGRYAVYHWAPNGQSGSRIPPAYWRAFGDAVTSRNWRTVLRLQEIAGRD